MTVAAHSRAAEVADIEQAIATLREAGLRVSAARRLLLEALFAASGPVSAERLARSHGAGTSPGDLASVYRNLERFEELGIVRHVHLGHGPGLYGLARGGEREYLVCERCGAVRSVESERLDRLRAWVREQFEFSVRFTHFPLAGLCSSCAESVRGPDHEQVGSIQAGGAMTHHDEHEHGEHAGEHAHEHEHGAVSHSHAHTEHDHEHTEHEHEHSHGDLVHSHPHSHQQGLERDHEHDHEDDRESSQA